MESVDTLLHGRWVIPVEPEGVVWENHAIAIKNGEIVAILPTEEAKQSFQADHQADLSDHALIPGLINTHTHAAMTLLRGLADDLPLMEWLTEHIWPAESTWVNKDFVRDGTRLAVAEMLRGGVTCFNDMYFFPDVVAEVCSQAHMRASVGMIVLDFPTIWASNADEYIDKGLQVHDDVKYNPLITAIFAPHAPYTVSDAPLQRIGVLMEELDSVVHMHVHETAHEVNECVTNLGKRPLQRLDELGLVGPRLLAVHMTQLSEAEIQLVAERGVHVAHCPESNLKLASGFCPVSTLSSRGVNVALGTDGAASNNDLNMFGEMRTAALLAKGVAGDPSTVPAHTALAMATIHAARALNLDQVTGSLAPGKAADIVAVDFNNLETQPFYDPISQLVYATGRDKVSDVWVAGKQVLKNRILTTLDHDDLLVQARTWRDKIAS